MCALGASACAATLTHLNLGGCNTLTNAAARAVGARCDSLGFLDVNGCRKIDDVGVSALAAGACAATLTHLNLQNCDLITTQGVAALAKCTRLRTLSLLGLDEVDERVFRLLKPLRALQSLEMQFCDVSDARLRLFAERDRRYGKDGPEGLPFGRKWSGRRAIEPVGAAAKLFNGLQLTRLEELRAAVQLQARARRFLVRKWWWRFRRVRIKAAVDMSKLLRGRIARVEPRGGARASRSRTRPRPRSSGWRRFIDRRVARAVRGDVARAARRRVQDPELLAHVPGEGRRRGRAAQAAPAREAVGDADGGRVRRPRSRRASRRALPAARVAPLRAHDAQGAAAPGRARDAVPVARSARRAHLPEAAQGAARAVARRP